MAVAALASLSLVAVWLNRSESSEGTAPDEASGAASTIQPDLAPSANVQPPTADATTQPDDSFPRYSKLSVDGIVGLSLVAIPGSAEPGGLISIDLESGDVGRGVARSYSGTDPPTISVRNNDTIVLGKPPDESYVVDASGTVTLIGVGPDTDIVGALNDRRVWIVESRTNEITLRRAEVTRDGIAPVGDRTTYPDMEALGDDGHGDVTISGPGGTYVVSDAGTKRLTTGLLLAISANTAFVRECDETLVCNDEVIDRRTGERTRMENAWSIEPMTQRIGLGSLPTISPDGGAALVQSSLFGATDRWILIDFVQQTAVEVQPPDQTTPVVWAKDNRTAAWIADSTLQVSQPRLGDDVGSVTELTELGALGNITTASSAPQSVPVCSDDPAPACLADADTLDAGFDIDLDVFELPIALTVGACTSGGTGAGVADVPEVDWELCAVPLDDGRQIVIGRAKDPDLIVRTTLSQRSVEFPANNGPGQVTILNEASQTFSLIGADGETVGRLNGPALVEIAPG